MRLIYVMMILAALFGCASPDGNKPMEDSIRYEGGWVGDLDLGLAKLRIGFSIIKGENGYTATIDSPDQGAFGIPGDTVQETTAGLTISSTPIAASLEIRKPETSMPETLQAVWKQAGSEFPLELERRPLPLDWSRPQEVGGELPYSEEDLSFDGGEAAVVLAGTLSLPDPQTFTGPRPLAILISGSGPQDRDESLMGHRPFKVLADHLLRQGIAVLRYDDRGTAQSSGDYPSAKLDDFAQDAAAAYRFARSLGFTQVGFIGHSEGGLILGKVAAVLQEAPAFAVSLAGPAVKGLDILLAQTRAILLSQGQPESVADQLASLNAGIYRIVLEESDSAKAAQQISQSFAQMGLPEEAIQIQLASLMSPWFKDFLSYDPAEDLAELARKTPVYAIYGSLDVQVPAAQNAPAFEQILAGAPALASSGVRVFEGKNHLFQPAVTGGLEEYAAIETTMDPEITGFLASWILEASNN